MRSRPSNLSANHRASERANVLEVCCLSLCVRACVRERACVCARHPRSFFHPRVGREKGERFITAFIARRVLAGARTAACGSAYGAY